ncbi:hypothetical protein Tlie_1268 [Thermovirga lienii DSM 17291]|jgi:hypothetical protein|uniref:DUF4391 domain-containing protein n=1 Tax=Thermovirga lienii (strain ATCC BAA-1197 / DSM 17291 / Cas60314) TaxID=580340 RepID=G7V612_THELD|nr:DUF4391 domain-containing protein [Thermovirga lienii]AER66999.1 hypothetical protein Tlie_1268 [Thermovirga lienii DSM 17291]
MICERIIDCLGLPVNTRIDQRVPKDVLSDQAAATASDRRLVKDGIDSLIWLVSLKPSNIGVPSYVDDQREYLEIAILQLRTRDLASKGAGLTRVTELLHRAIPYPVLLIVEGEETFLSVAHKRWSQNEKDKMVLEDNYPHSSVITENVPEAFWGDLALDRQPKASLLALYQGWLACLVALDAWRETGRYCLFRDIDQLPQQRQQLHEVRELANEIARLRKQATKERQIARQVELNLQIKRLEAERKALLNSLRGGVH